MSVRAEALADFEQAIVAIASSSEPSLRGVVRLSGLNVADILDRMAFYSLDSRDPIQWARSDDPSSARPYRINLELDLSHPIGRVPVSVLYWPTTRSYTGQPSAEVHLIGSQPLLSGVVDNAVAAGARAARPGEFTLRAFLGGRLDLTQAEAVLGVIEAEGRGALNQALEQLAGNLSRPLEALRHDVLNLLADVEAGLDFVDEDIEFISDSQLIDRLQNIASQIQIAWDTMRQRGGGQIQPLIALRGEPNAGKSLLMNSLAEANAAIVADVPGTTRDVVYSLAKLGDREVRLADTAGIEPGRCDIERRSQEQARAESDRACMRLWCVDSSRPDFLQAITNLRQLARLEEKPSVIDVWVATKMDQCPVETGELERALAASGLAELSSLTLIACSALTGEGISALKERLQELLDSLDREEVGSVLGTAARCNQTFSRAQEAVENAIGLTRHQDGHEFVASEIRVLSEALGEVTGAVYTDDLLDRVFSRFCIGK